MVQFFSALHFSMVPWTVRTWCDDNHTNVDHEFINPLPLMGIIVGILILRRGIINHGSRSASSLTAPRRQYHRSKGFVEETCLLYLQISKLRFVDAPLRQCLGKHENPCTHNAFRFSPSVVMLNLDPKP